MALTIGCARVLAGRRVVRELAREDAGAPTCKPLYLGISGEMLVRNSSRSFSISPSLF